MTIIPPIKTQWIKTKLMDFIKFNLPNQTNWKWIEPFLWSWVVWFNLAWKEAIFADSNPHLINFYNALNSWTISSCIVRNFLEKEWKELSEKGVIHYQYIRDRFNDTWNPLDFLFLNRSCFNWMIRFNRKWWFNVPFCKKNDRFSKSYITKIVNQVDKIQSLMQQNHRTFICQDFQKTIWMGNPIDFIYADPPYIGRHVDYYDSWCEENEVLLRDSLIQFWWKFMVSTRFWNKYRQNVYIDTLWKDFSIQTMEHFYFVWGKEDNRNIMLEAIIMNYSL